MNAISVTELTAFSRKALVSAGLTEADAADAADVLVTTDTFGVLSHGTKNLYQYVLKMRAGGLNASAQPAVEAEGPSWAIVDGNAALGMLSACKAMNLAVEKAGKTGIGYVGVHNSCHFGAAGYYANLAAKHGMLGISMSNGDPVMAIPNSAGVAIGNNPFSFAAPIHGGKSVFLDIALSNVAALKVVMAKEKGAPVPREWLVDEHGEPTSDPSGFPESSHLQPMGAHKGYGLAMMVEILAAVMTGAGMLSEVVSWNLKLPEKNGVGHAFIALDIAQMLPIEQFEDRMEKMITELKSAPKARGADKIFVPGEMEWEKRGEALRLDRLEIPDAHADNLRKLSELTGIKLHWLPDEQKERKQ